MVVLVSLLGAFGQFCMIIAVGTVDERKHCNWLLLYEDAFSVASDLPLDDWTDSIFQLVNLERKEQSRFLKLEVSMNSIPRQVQNCILLLIFSFLLSSKTKRPKADRPDVISNYLSIQSCSEAVQVLLRNHEIIGKRAKMISKSYFFIQISSSLVFF